MRILTVEMKNSLYILLQLAFFVSSLKKDYDQYSLINIQNIFLSFVAYRAKLSNASFSILFTLTLSVHLNPLFNWNVKQLFVYLTAEYETPANKLNQVKYN